MERRGRAPSSRPRPWISDGSRLLNNMPDFLTTEIINEIGIAVRRLGGSLPGEHITPNNAYEAAKDAGAKSDLLGTIGSWRDTMPDEWVLEELKSWNKAHKV
jgi:hypothetical protein